jgi:hypothetical protein
LCLANQTFARIIVAVPIDPKSLPQDPVILQRMLVDLTGQLDKAPISCSSLSQNSSVAKAASKDDDKLPPPEAGSGQGEGQDNNRSRGRRPLAPHLKRQRIVHDLSAEESTAPTASGTCTCSARK